MRLVFHHLGMAGVATVHVGSVSGHIRNRADLTFSGKTVTEAEAAFRRMAETYRGGAR